MAKSSTYRIIFTKRSRCLIRKGKSLMGSIKSNWQRWTGSASDVARFISTLSATPSAIYCQVMKLLSTRSCSKPSTFGRASHISSFSMTVLKPGSRTTLKSTIICKEADLVSCLFCFRESCRPLLLIYQHETHTGRSARLHSTLAQINCQLLYEDIWHKFIDVTCLCDSSPWFWVREVLFRLIRIITIVQFFLIVGIFTSIIKQTSSAKISIMCSPSSPSGPHVLRLANLKFFLNHSGQHEVSFLLSIWRLMMIDISSGSMTSWAQNVAKVSSLEL